MDHTSRNDAAGADGVGNHGDTAAPAALPIVAERCKPPGAVDLVLTRHGDRMHLSAAEWAEFTAAVKAGKYDAAGT
jgi:hypothetical protein